MLQTLFIYLKHHKVINSFQKTNRRIQNEKAQPIAWGILFVLSLGDFDETSLNFPNLLKTR